MENREFHLSSIEVDMDIKQFVELKLNERHVLLSLLEGWRVKFSPDKKTLEFYKREPLDELRHMKLPGVD